MNTLIQDLVFSRMKSETTGHTLGKTIKLEETFLSVKEEIILTLQVFDPKKCYRYEGAK